MLGPYLTSMKRLHAWSFYLHVWFDQGRRQVFRKLVYVLWTTHGKKGAIAIQPMRGLLRHQKAYVNLIGCRPFKMCSPVS